MIFFVTAKGQSSYAEAMQQGDVAFIKKDYKTAIKKYYAAQALAPDKENLVREKVNISLDSIDALRTTVRKLKHETVTAKIKVIKSENKTLLAMVKVQNLSDALYFYEGRFALAFSNNKYYFIDKNGDKVEKLRDWDKAEKFEETGFAKVKIAEPGEVKSYMDFILDTSGHYYKSIYNINDIARKFTAVSLSHKKLDSLPTRIFTNQDIQVLILNDNNLFDFSGLIGNLKKLTTLNLYKNNLQGLPNEIEELKELKELNLGRNKLMELPKGIRKLENLEKLNLEFNYLDSFPKEIANLKKLTELNLSSNNLTKLPREIEELGYLKSLDISYNDLNILPSEIVKLKYLTELNLARVRLDSLPDYIGLLTNLKTLYLYGNYFTGLPNQIGKLKNLTGLELASNLLTSLPKSIGNLKSLTWLDLSENSLTFLPKEIGKLQNLTFLGLENNKLTNLPKEIAQLKNLTELNLNGNSIPVHKIIKIKKLLPNCEIKY
jgi:Leucine-rich repeat (LRR) protein